MVARDLDRVREAERRAPVGEGRDPIPGRLEGRGPRRRRSLLELDRARAEPPARRGQRRRGILAGRVAAREQLEQDLRLCVAAHRPQQRVERTCAGEATARACAAVVIQDPVWERSFPEVGGVVMPFYDQTTQRFVAVRLTEREAARRREENEALAAELIADLRALDLAPVIVTSTNRDEIFQAFLGWADERIVSRGRWW